MWCERKEKGKVSMKMKIPALEKKKNSLEK